ncbi:DNA methyltransferase [Lysinibacillus sp. LZ02]|uniref:DNA-methyltransferase n=1 Tax=Lysinibacillus sp. LZ02 TaxID=3420668 RepID=UPI003D367231
MREELYSILELNSQDEKRLFAKKIGIELKKLNYYNANCIYPDETYIKKILNARPHLSELELKLRLGNIDQNVISLLKDNLETIKTLKPKKKINTKLHRRLKPIFSTRFGELYNEDCIEVLKHLPSNSVDLIFADPPFNLNKEYESGINDNLSKTEYLNWTESWLTECIRVLKDGGAIFIWNIPSWNTYSSEILNKHLNFRHWIVADVKYSLPIPNKLYPAHYSLLYYIKGNKPNTFNQERLPLEICPHCSHDIKDYGGYKNKLNPKGISLTDVWKDISPVRHKKYKTRNSNELPLNLLERIISMTTNEGDIILDPFGGSGTTFIVSEVLKRNWIGIEIGPINDIIRRFDNIKSQENLIKTIQKNKNQLFTEEMIKARIANKQWLPEDFK